MKDKQTETNLRLIALQLESWKKLHDLITYGLDKAKPIISVDQERQFTEVRANLLQETEHVLRELNLLGELSGRAMNVLNRGTSLRAVRELSKKWGNCFVVLKGHQTMIGQSREDLFINCSGNPHLAQGGSGDLLAGYLAGLLAQPALRQMQSKTIQYAIWQHGAAADELSARRANWTVEDLADVLGSVLPA